MGDMKSTETLYEQLNIKNKNKTKKQALFLASDHSIWNKGSGFYIL